MAENARRILIPIDGSAHSLRAFEWYRDHVRKPEDFVYLCHCVEPLQLKTLSFKQPLKVPSDEWSTAIQANIDKAKKLEDEYSILCERGNIKRHEFHCMTSDKNPGETLSNFAKQKDINLIVVGNRGIGKVRRTFLGSTSDYLIHHVQIPITVVPPKK